MLVGPANSFVRVQACCEFRSVLTSHRLDAALTVHVAASVGWVGGLLCFLALAVAVLTLDRRGEVQAMYVAMNLLGRWALVPLSLATFVSGLVQSVGTVWGLLRHYYWVIVKLGLTLVATLILLLYTETMRDFAANAADPARDLDHVRQLSPVLHASGGLVFLMGALVLSIFKPRGVTRFGWRRQQESYEARRRTGPAAT